MPITGLWQEANLAEAGAAKWGHGINPIHSIQGAGYGGRSNDPVHTSQGPEGLGGNTIGDEYLDLLDPAEGGYTDEDFASALWGYGPQTGTSDRPAIPAATEDFRGHTNDDFPSPGYHQAGLPGGTNIRAEAHGQHVSANAKLGDKEETVGEGWENKETGTLENAVVSDPSQYERQTSMQQRDQTRAGSQNPNTGTASEHSAPIGSWRPTWNQRIKPWSGGRRHYDMEPKEQNDRIRPFWYRSAGTGYVEYMGANEARNYMTEPMQRQPVPDPYAGVPVPQAGNVYVEESYPVQDYVNVWY
jgi:hypothetical protein